MGHLPRAWRLGLSTAPEAPKEPTRPAHLPSPCAPLRPHAKDPTLWRTGAAKSHAAGPRRVLASLAECLGPISRVQSAAVSANASRWSELRPQPSASKRVSRDAGA